MLFILIKQERLQGIIPASCFLPLASRQVIKEVIILLETDRAIIVEGKYDKIKLSGVVKAVIICTDGFRVFTDRDKLALIRHYAETTGIIILTDSDRAGFKIRNFLKGSVNGNIINVYIPDIFGKERRKNAPSKEGKLGVEGMDEDVLRAAFEKAGITEGSPRSRQGDIGRLLLYELGLSGGQDSRRKRQTLCRALGLPCGLTAGGLTEVLNTMLTADRLLELMNSPEMQEAFGQEVL